MAKNKIEIDVEVDDKGQTKKLGLESKKAAKGMDDVGKGARTADRNIKGAAQASSGASKNFSKMSQGMGGLVGAYATLAANIFAITAAFGFFKRAADVAALSRGQEAYAIKTGSSMKLLTSRVQEATGGILAFNEASQAVAIGTAAGLSSDQLTGLATVAKNASVALGRDLTDSFNRLTRGAIKAEPELLDELGIIIRLNTVTEEYGRVVGKAADDLTQFEKTQAVVNAVLAQGNEKFDEVGNNINQVARLGKKFTDLVKNVGDFIDPLTKFVSGALANNIVGLTAAFSGLGISIGRALMPAMPAMESIDDLAKTATKDLQGIAGAGATADKMRDGTFDEDVLRRLKKAHQSKTSTVINLDQMEKTERLKNINIIEAAHLRAMANEKSGVRRWYLNWKANLAALQAEHGKTMGFMKASTAAMVSGVNKLLTGLAIVGMLYTVITLAKEFINTFKDPAIKEMQEAADILSERFQEQNKEITKLVKNFKEGVSPMENIVKQANLLANFSFSGVEGMVDKLGMSGTKTVTVTEMTPINTTGANPLEVLRQVQKEVKDLPEQNEKVTKSLRDVFTSLSLQGEALVKFGITADGATAKFMEGIEGIGGALSTLEDPFSSAEDYNAALLLIQKNFPGIVAEAQKLNPVLAAQKAAIEGIGQNVEVFDKFRESVGQAKSQFSEFLAINKSFAESLNTLTMSGTMGEYFGPSQEGLARMSAYSKLLGISLETLKSMTKEQVIQKLSEQNLRIRQSEHKIEIQALQTKRKILRLGMQASPLQAAELERQGNIVTLQDSIVASQERMKILAEAGAKTDQTKVEQEQEKLNLLLQQLAVAELQNDFTQKQLAAAKAGTESSAKKEFAALLKGEESSISEAFGRIAKSAVDSVLDAVAEKAAKLFTDFLFGSPEQSLEVAMATNTAAINANTAALGGATVATNANTSKGLLGGVGDFFKDFKLPGWLGGGGGSKVDVSMAKPTTFSSSFTAGDHGEVNLVETFAEDMGDTTMSIKESFTEFGAEIGDIFDSDSSFLSKIGESFTSFGAMMKNMFTASKDFLGDLFKGMFGGSAAPAARNGGVFGPGGKLPGYAAGGIASGSTAGYPAVLHGTEAVVPLPNNKKIPVEMRGGGDQNNNIVINVASDGSVSANGNVQGDQERMGKAIAKAVREELKTQKRSGGMLNPYGVA